MSRGFPSMTALLGLLAVVGYQNRDKLAELLGGQGSPGAPGAGGQQGGLGQVLGGFGGKGGVGGLLGGGLGELLERFKQNGQGDVADSWVARGPNKRSEERRVGKEGRDGWELTAGKKRGSRQITR